MIRLSTVQKLQVEIYKSAQSAHQADGSSPLKVVGETKLSFTRGQHVFQFEGLVVENLDVEVLAGTPLMEANDIAVLPAKRLINLADSAFYTRSFYTASCTWRCSSPRSRNFNHFTARRLYRTRTAKGSASKFCSMP